MRHHLSAHVTVAFSFALLALVSRTGLGIELTWQRATANAGFSHRDSAGEFVYGNKMWIMGGWFSGTTGTTTRRDVWSSADGVTWTRATASTPALDWGEHPTTLVFQDKMWTMGGYRVDKVGNNPVTSSSGNQIWNSTNGTNWSQVVTNGPQWSKRSGAAGVVFNNKMWIMGGTQFETSGVPVFNDVWSSSDGINWTLEKANAPWSARAFQHVLVFNDEIWLLGGGRYDSQTTNSSQKFTVNNDVWKSSDGKNWTRVDQHADWDARIWHGATVYNGEMWVLGGAEGHGLASYQNDAWHSSDGVHWEQATTAAGSAIWSPRHEMSIFDFQGKLWVVAGGSANGTMSDVWQTSYAVPAILPGDFNHDHVVDAADYVVWRKDPSVGTYEEWRANFGASGGSGLGDSSALSGRSSVPEPASLLLVAIGVLTFGTARRKRERA